MADASAGEKKRGWFGRRAKGGAAEGEKSGRRGDLTVIALGVTLCLICALFPWYIFLNQDKFAIGGQALALVPGLGGGPKLLTPRGDDDGRPAKDGAVPVEKLDLFATGTAPERAGDEEPEAPTPAEQPFPAAPVRFHVVHIENGRAMIEDDSGLFVVGRGDLLPDDSRVAHIEKRDGRMVLVTSTDKVLEAE